MNPLVLRAILLTKEGLLREFTFFYWKFECSKIVFNKMFPKRQLIFRCCGVNKINQAAIFDQISSGLKHLL